MASNQALTVGLEDLFAALKRRWKPIVAAAVLSGMLAFLWAKTLPPSYRAQGAILVRSVALTSPDGPGTYRDVLNKEVTVATEQDFMNADAFVSRIAEIIQPSKRELRPAFVPSFLLDIGGSADRTPSLADRVQWLRSHVKIEANDASNIITVSCTSPSPALSALIVNTIFREYNAVRSEQHRDLLAQVTTTLRNRIADVESQSNQAESSALSMLRYPAVLQGFGNSMMMDDVTQLKTSLRQAQADSALRQSQFEAAASARAAARGDAEKLAAAGDSPLLTQLRARLTLLEQEDAKVASNRGPRHPERMAIAEQRAEVEQSIKQETNRIIAGLGTQYSAAQRYQRQLQADINQVGNQLQSGRGDAVRMQQLRAKVDSLRSTADAMRKELEQILSRGGVPQSRVVAPAIVPFKNIAPSAAVAAVFAATFVGAALSLLVIVRAQMQAGRLGGRGYLGQLIERPILGAIPNFRGRRRDWPSPATMITDRGGSDPLTESVRSLVLKLEMDVLRDGKGMILGTSSFPGEGKSTTLGFLGVQFALCRYNVLIIDADLRRPRMSSLFQQGDPSGGVLEQATVAGCHYSIWASNSASLSTLSLNESEQPPHLLFRSPMFAELIAWARQNYDVVLVDAPPVLSVSDPILLSRFVDGVVLVAAPHAEGLDALTETVRRLSEAKAPIVGVIMTKLNHYEEGYYANTGYAPMPRLTAQ